MAFKAGAIVSEMTLDRSRFSASMKAVQKQTRALGGWVKQNSAQIKRMGLVIAAAGTAALAVFSKMVKKYVEVGDMVHKMSIRTGFAATTLSELAYAADISGADLTMLEKGVKKMSKTIVDAGYGLETYLRVFRSLGLDVQSLMTLAPEEQFLKIGFAIAAMENDTLKTAAAVDVFGRAGTMLLPLFEEGPEGIRKLREEAHKLGIVFDEEAAAKAAALKDAQTALKGSVQGLSIAILNDLIPVITNVVKEFTNWFVSSRTNAQTWALGFINFFKTIAEGIKGLMLAWGTFKVFAFKLGEEIVRHLAVLTAGIVIVTGYTKKMGMLGKTHEAAKIALKNLLTIGMEYSENVEEQVDKMTEAITWFDKLAESLETLGTKIKTGKEDLKGLGGVLTMTVLPPARQLADIFEKMVGAALPPARELPGLFENVVTKMEENVAAFTEKTKKGFWDIYREAALFTSSLSSLFNQITENQMANIQKEYDARKSAIEGSLMTEKSKADAMEKLDKEFEKKRKKAMRAQAARTKVVGWMEAMIHTASAIVEALPNIPLSIAVGIMGAAQAAFIAAMPLPSFAKGGKIGEVGVVGERGPELFFPRTPGEIVPIRETATPLAPQVILNFNPAFYLSSIDPQTARDVVRSRIGPELLDMLKAKIMLPEFQDALRIR